ncbi:MAG: hypothetical protein ACOYL6_16225 [Bacteriovoracaceae bacterium]
MTNWILFFAFSMVAGTAIADNTKELDLKITELRKLVDTKDETKLKNARARLCPKDFTHAEIDGLTPTELRDGVVGSTRRQNLAYLCGVQDNTPHKPLSKVFLKVDSCSCYHEQMGDLDPITVNSKVFPSKSSSGKIECSKAKFHVYCSVMQDCGGECHSGTIACPVECLSFK